VSARVISRLVVKDCSLMWFPIAAYTVAALAGLFLVAAGGTIGRTAGITLAVNVLIGVTFHVLLGPVLGERERKTLAFVMSLPVTPRDAALGKLVSAFVLFLIPATVAATTLVFLSPVDVFHAMATSDRSVLSHLAGWAAYYALVLGAWLLFFSVVLAAAIVSESIGWTVAVLSGLVFVVGNFVLQVAPLIGWVGRYLRDLTRGGPAVPATLLVEAVGIVLVVGAMLTLQGRKTSFV
jgi:ABC-2 type transport system permease protein